MVLLDLRVAFETTDHTLLLGKLENLVELTGIVLSWFRSYLIDRCVNGEMSNVKWSSTRFCLRTTVIVYGCHIYGLNFHCYTDDAQMYQSGKTEDKPRLNKFEDCVMDIKDWMLHKKCCLF